MRLVRRLKAWVMSYRLMRAYGYGRAEAWCSIISNKLFGTKMWLYPRARRKRMREQGPNVY